MFRTLFPVGETICWDGMKNLCFFPAPTPSTFSMDFKTLPSGRVGHPDFPQDDGSWVPSPACSGTGVFEIPSPCQKAGRAHIWRSRFRNVGNEARMLTASSGETLLNSGGLDQASGQPLTSQVILGKSSPLL